MIRWMFAAGLLAAGVLLRAESVTLSVLSTTDLHGNLRGYDYFTAQPAPRGLARVATLIRRERQVNPNSLLVDCGDTIQGSPLETVYQSYVRTGSLPLGRRPAGPLPGDPVMRAMNELGFDAMAVGNHEFNFGLDNLNRARADARFPWLAANIAVEPGAVVKPFEPYMVKTIAGVRVGIVGVITPGVPQWEKPENYRGYRFLPGPAEVKAAVADLRRRHQPDVVVVIAHSGLGRDLRTGQGRAGDLAGENMADEIARTVTDVDVLLFGHTHQQLAEARIGDVLLGQAKNWGMALEKVEITLEREPQGKWRVTRKQGALLPVTIDTPEDPAIVALAKPYHEATEQYLATPVARAEAPLSAAQGRIEDTALVDAIHAVQLHYGQADVSLTALFNPRLTVPAGPVTVREIAALYIYDNEVYAIQGNGKMLRAALENAARYFLPCPTPACDQGPLINRQIPGYNFDIAQGVTYEIDLSRPLGQRIQNLRFRGEALKDDQTLRIALNNYRAAGSAGYEMFKGAPVLYRSGREIRDLLIDYYTERRTLPTRPDGNWRIVPETARRTLEQETRAESSRPASQ